MSGGFDGTVRLWDLRTGAPRKDPLRGHAGRVSALAVGQVGSTPVAVTGGLDGTVRRWDLKTGTARGKLVGHHGGEVTAIAIGDVDGITVAVTGNDSGVISWQSLERGRHASGRLDAPARVETIAYIDHVGWLAATKDGSLFLWRPILPL